MEATSEDPEVSTEAAKTSKTLLALALNTLEDARRPNASSHKLILIFGKVTTFLKEYRPEEDPAKLANDDGSDRCGHCQPLPRTHSSAAVISNM